MSGTDVSEGVKCYVRTSQDLADLQPAEMMKILKTFTMQSMQIRHRTIDEISEIAGLSWRSGQ
jgi:hypothetical protein